jgi:hypothetical protein
MARSIYVRSLGVHQFQKDAQWHTDLTILHDLDAALSPVACIKSQNLYHKSVTVFLIQDIN